MKEFAATIAKRKLIFSTLILLIISTFFGAPVFGQSTELTQSELAQLETYQKSFRKIAQNILPVVVEINIVEVVQQRVSRFNSPFEFFFGSPNKSNQQQPEEREFRREGLGSGVIVRKDGKTIYVLTNNHVAGDAAEITIRLHDGREFEAELVGKDPRVDLALVKFETDQNIPVAKLGDSESLEVGDWALAVGNPLGFESTITLGIVSAIGRNAAPGMEIGGYTDYIQTDAAINQGNSGGALVNIYGEVIGINTWIASGTGGNIGLGFAIPVNNAKRVIDDIISDGDVKYGWLGVNAGNPSEDIRDALNFPETNGAFVFSVYKDSPAHKGGLLPGDLIVKVDNAPVQSSSDLVRKVGRLVPGRTYTFEVSRMGRTESLRVKIDPRLEESEIAGLSKKLWPGIAVTEITDQIKRRLNLRDNMGKIIIGSVQDSSSADLAGLRTGDIIKEVNGRRVSTIQDFYRQLNDTSKDEILLRIYRDGSELIIGLVR